MSQGADYRVDLSIYNGPLDLLLYLIREREVDIHDIPIRDITEQFLSHLEVVKRIDVDRAGDFLLMAATLMLIKSRMLLPRHDDEEDGDEGLDPRTDLVRQLLEYKQFKDLSRDLAGAEDDRARRFESGLRPPDPEAPDAGKLLEEIGVDDLLLAFERLMRETLAEVDHRVFGEDLPLRELTPVLIEEIRLHGGSKPFRDLFATRRDRYYIVSVLLCLLEMLRTRRATVEAGDDVLDLVVRLREDDAHASADPVARGVGGPEFPARRASDPPGTANAEESPGPPTRPPLPRGPRFAEAEEGLPGIDGMPGNDGDAGNGGGGGADRFPGLG